MFNKEENLNLEIEKLIENVEHFQDKMDVYCEFMKGAILNTSGLN